MVSQITADLTVCLNVGLTYIKENIKGRVTDPLWGETTGDPHGFPPQRASNTARFPFDDVIMSSDNGLAPNRRQAILWRNDRLVGWRIYALLGSNMLTIWAQVLYMHLIRP